MSSAPIPPPPAAAVAPHLTVVLPCYNEQDHVLLEIERITKSMEASGYAYELLVIDDASTDGTLRVLQEALLQHEHMRLLPFRRNGGARPARRHRAQPARRASSASA